MNATKNNSHLKIFSNIFVLVFFFLYLDMKVFPTKNGTWIENGYCSFSLCVEKRWKIIVCMAWNRWCWWISSYTNIKCIIFVLLLLLLLLFLFISRVFTIHRFCTLSIYLSIYLTVCLVICVTVCVICREHAFVRYLFFFFLI